MQASASRAPQSSVPFAASTPAAMLRPTRPGRLPSRSINLGNEALTRHLRALVADVALPRRHLDLDRSHVFVGNLLQKMGNAVEAGLLLVVRVHDVPGACFAVRGGEHDVLGFGILAPMLA